MTPLLMMQKQTPRAVLMVALIAGGAACALSVFGAWGAASAKEWIGLGFEVLAVVAGGFGIATGLGKFRGSHPLALLCVGGTIAVAAIMALQSSSNLVRWGRLPRVIAGDPLTLGRVAIGGLFVALAAFVLIMRKPRESLRLLGWSGACLLSGVALAGAWIYPATRSLLVGMPGPITAIFAIVSFLGIVALVSVGGHCAIRALQVGCEADDVSAAT